MVKPKSDAVHRHFSYDNSNNTSHCNICGTTLKGKHTSNLKSHLSAKHLSEFSDVVTINKYNQLTRHSRLSDQTDSENRTDNLKNLCMQLVAVNGRPLALISDDSFRHILALAAMAPKTKQTPTPPKEINERSVKALIPETAYKIKMKIAEEIRDSLICLKVDSATSSERKFFGVNIQYLKEDKIVIRNLAVSEIFQRQTAEFLKEKLREILDEFYIPTEQIYSVTTDNGSNMKKLVKLFNGSYCSEDLLENSEDDDDSDTSYDEQWELSEEDTHLELEIIRNTLTLESYRIRGMLCAAHTLQLAIKDAINENVEVQVTLDVVRKVSKILRTPTNRNLLKLANLKVPIIDCATRWTSKYDMLVRLQSLKAFCENITEVSRLCSAQLWEETDQSIICLKPLYEMTLFLQKEQLTAGDFYINWMSCKSKITDINHAFASSLLKFMEIREKSLLNNDIMLEALYLDGRVNVMLTQQQCEKAKVLLKQTRRRLQQYKQTVQNISNDDINDLSDGVLDVSEIEVEPVPSTSAFAALERILSERARERLLSTTTLTSFDTCLQELQNSSRIPLDTNIIGHWSNKSSTASELSAVARTVLAIPVTQVSVERMFSSLKFILSPLRSNLAPSLLQQMLLIRANKDLLE